MNGNILGHIFVICVCACLSIAAIRKKDDPVLDTQTNPIAHKQKVEEVKDGIKGAPTPSFDHFPDEKFHLDPPIDKEDKENLDLEEPLLDDDSLIPAADEESESDWNAWLEEEENEFKKSNNMDVSQN